MATNIFASKGTLISTQKSLSLAKTGYELMDKKRNILIREMMLLIDKAKSVQSSIDKIFSSAYIALENANISSGVIEEIAESVPIDNSIKIRYRSVMGVEIPYINSENDSKNINIPYGLAETNIEFDNAYIHFQSVKELCIELAEIENSIYRLAIAIKRTQRRANSLKNIVIPRQEEEIKYIKNTLEERDREEFSRMKVIKNKNKD